MKYIDKSYIDKSRLWINYSKKPEIEYYLDLLCEYILGNGKVIVKNDNNHLINILDDIICKLKFNDYNIIYHTLKDFLIKGHLVYEIVYDDHQRVIGFNRLPEESLVPSYDHDREHYWTQYENSEKKRLFLDSQIVFISYSNLNNNYMSYIERLMKPYNNLKLIEDCIIIKHLDYLSTKTKKGEHLIDVPDRVSIEANMDDFTGEVFVESDNKYIPFFENVIFTLSVGDSPPIQENTLNSSENVKYFEEKLRQSALVLPVSDLEKIRLLKFKSFLSSVFLEIVKKPLISQSTISGLNIDPDDIIIEFG